MAFSLCSIRESKRFPEAPIHPARNAITLPPPAKRRSDTARRTGRFCQFSSHFLPDRIFAAPSAASR